MRRALILGSLLTVLLAGNVLFGLWIDSLPARVMNNADIAFLIFADVVFGIVSVEISAEWAKKWEAAK